MKHWEIIADNLSKAGGVGAMFDASIPMGTDSSACVASGWRAKNG
jgi:hypothetical protein